MKIQEPKGLKMNYYITAASKLLRKAVNRKKRLAKYKGYNIASSGDEMFTYVNAIREFHDIEVSSIFEIGANFGQDAEVLAECFGVPEENCWLFEAHPQIAEAAQKLHPKMNVFNLAVADKDGEIKMNLVDIHSKNTGISSMRNHVLNSVCGGGGLSKDIPCVRIDSFVAQNNLDSIDFVKIDVEGCTWEVLQGFGEKLALVKCLELEAEHTEAWEGEVLYPQIAEFLTDKGFDLKLFDRKRTQSDSLWIKKDFFNVD